MRRVQKALRSEVSVHSRWRKQTYSAPGGDGHVPQLILSVVSESWSLDRNHLEADLQPAVLTQWCQSTGSLLVHFMVIKQQTKHRQSTTYMYIFGLFGFFF